MKRTWALMWMTSLCLLGSMILISPRDAGAVPVDRAYNYDAISDKGKAAIAKFRSDYRAFLERELNELPSVMSANIIATFEACLDHNYEGDLQSCNRLLKSLDKTFPKQPVILWHLAVNYFVIARRLPETQSKEQARLLRAGFNKSATCLKIEPENPDCWLAFAASHGALALAEGIFETISEIDEVKDELHKAYRILDKETDRCPMAPWDADTRTVVVAALAEFYRLTPDWLLFRMIAGVRGDKKKSWSFAQKLTVRDLPTANVVARSALCFGADSENQALIDQGVEIVRRAIKFDLLHPFDEAEYRRLARLHNAIEALKDPEPDDYYDLGCKEFGNDDRSKLEKKR